MTIDADVLDLMVDLLRDANAAKTKLEAQGVKNEANRFAADKLHKVEKGAKARVLGFLDEIKALAFTF